MLREGSARTIEKSVLVVEDEVLVRLALADALRENGFRVIEAANSYEAKTVVQSTNSVAVMITDVNVPGLFDGLLLSKWVRETYPEIKIIIVAGALPPDCIPLADAVFPKPYDVQVIAKRVAQLMRNGGAPPGVECA